MRLFIQNMVCVRCKKIVEDQLEKIGIKDFTLEAGEAEIRDEMTEEQLNSFKVSIKKLGLELIDDRTTIIIEKIKNSIKDLIYDEESIKKTNCSEYLSIKTGYDYNHLSNLFSASQGTSIEKYYINQRIERVKELLKYSELSLSEISYKVHYSSVAHLSGQFKKETGLTPSNFRKINQKGISDTVNP